MLLNIHTMNLHTYVCITVLDCMQEIDAQINNTLLLPAFLIPKNTYARSSRDAQVSIYNFMAYSVIIIPIHISSINH